MRIAMTDLFAASLLALGPSPEDETGWKMTHYQVALLKFWGTMLPKGRLDSAYERHELLKQFFIWEQQERLLAQR